MFFIECFIIEEFLTAHTSSCDFSGNNSGHIAISIFTKITSIGSGVHWKHVLNKICANEKERETLCCHYNNNILKLSQINVKGFAYHFLLEVDGGGFPLLEFF